MRLRSERARGRRTAIARGTRAARQRRRSRQKAGASERSDDRHAARFSTSASFRVEEALRAAETTRPVSAVRRIGRYRRSFPRPCGRHRCRRQTLCGEAVRHRRHCVRQSCPPDRKARSARKLIEMLTWPAPPRGLESPTLSSLKQRDRCGTASGNDLSTLAHGVFCG